MPIYKSKVLMFVVLASILLSIVGIILYRSGYISEISQSQLGNSDYIIQIERQDVTDQFLIDSVGQVNIIELGTDFIRIKGIDEIQEKLIESKIKYSTISSSFPEKNNYAIYTVKISDNFLNSKLQEIARYSVILQKKYNWIDRKNLNSTYLVWGDTSGLSTIKNIKNIDYVSEYRLYERIDPTLIKLLRDGQSASNIRIQIYNINKVKVDDKNDPLISTFQNLNIILKSSPKSIKLESSGIGLEYIVEADLDKLVSLIKKHPEIILVF